VIQFGIASEPEETSKWDELRILDDPVSISNTIGTISFATAGPDTRTTQLFINLNDNSRLDALGFTPIGKVIQGMDILQQFIYNPTPNDSSGLDQQSYTSLGNDWILQYNPNVDLILNASLIVESE
jgi:peptidyl-prolyl cis-trans isomerase A (cyclophilin A)